MFTIDEKTTFVGITDLRTKARKMLGAMKDSRVVLTNRNRPCAVMLDYASYQKMRDLVEMAEEALDAETIRERQKNHRGRFLTHREMLLKLRSQPV